MKIIKRPNNKLLQEEDKMSVASDGEGAFSKEYLEEGIARLEGENEENPTPENEAAINLASEALENLGE